MPMLGTHQTYTENYVRNRPGGKCPYSGAVLVAGWPRRSISVCDGCLHTVARAERIERIGSIMRQISVTALYDVAHVER